jgi:TorA-specific chaperone
LSTPSSLSEKQKSIFLDGLRNMCGIFWGPSLEDCRKMWQGRYFQPFDELQAVLGVEAAEVISNTTVFLKAHPDASVLYERLEEEYVRLFISSKDGIPAPLYHSCYESEGALLMGEPAVMMKKRFQSKELSLADTLHEPPDHLSIELEYLYFLLQKGWSQKDRILIAEAAEFAGESMLPWVGTFRDRLSSAAQFPFYPLMAALLLCFLGCITAQV